MTRNFLNPALVLLLLAACASPQSFDGEALEIRGLVIKNQSFSLITEVVLLVVQSREFISCGNIPFRGQCSTTFPLRQYQGNDIEIRWRQDGQEWSTGEFVVEAAENINPAYPALVRVIITPSGNAVTELVQ